MIPQSNSAPLNQGYWRVGNSTFGGDQLGALSWGMSLVAMSGT
jgi:hypothetical protein